MNDISLSFETAIIVAVSGGADSLCLLGTLHEQGYPLIVAHFDHQLRPDSADDAKFVEEIAAQYELTFIFGSGDVETYAKEHKQTIEEAARNSRYHFFFMQARQHKAQAVAVGHTADDQVETILMHFLRGAGLSGLKGIQPQIILPAFDTEIPLVRPILHLWRSDTEAWCAAQNLTPREDPTNASQIYFRNRLRHTLIPELERYNPRFREVLQRTGAALSGDHAIITKLVEAQWHEIVLRDTSKIISFDLPAIAKLSIPLIRNVIRHGMEKLLPGQTDISFSTLQRAAQFIVSLDSAQRTDLAFGLLLYKERGALYLTDSPESLPLAAFPQMPVIANEARRSPSVVDEIVLTLPCEIDLGAGWVLTGESLGTAQMPETGDPFQVTLDADVLGAKLSLRKRRAGDRFQPLGMDGKSMKLKDFFINVKLLQRARERYPLLCVDDEILWVPGYRPAHRVRVTESTRRVVSFSLKKVS